MYEQRIIEELARDMKCEVSTAKERVKNLRKIDFLSAPGQGARGEGKATNKAIKVLKKEGILGA
jgi:Mn-dependent DtxR family transcriptional regulator